MSALVVLRLMPGTLNLNGSLGNAEVLATRATWYGAAVTSHDVEPGDALTTRPDIVTIGHGTSSTLATAAATINQWSATLTRWHADGVVFAGTGLGGDLLGQGVSDAEGTSHPGAGLIETRTQLGGHRFSGEIVGWDHTGRQCAGYLNDHTIREAGDSVSALITVDRPGLGQWTGATSAGGEGVVTPSVWVSALSGPLLALNPHLADDILRAVWQRRDAELPDRTEYHHTADRWAEAAREAITRRLS